MEKEHSEKLIITCLAQNLALMVITRTLKTAFNEHMEFFHEANPMKIKMSFWANLINFQNIELPQYDFGDEDTSKKVQQRTIEILKDFS